MAQAFPHDAQYADADITYGATLYAARCVTCHGAQGDAIGGVNLRAGVSQRRRRSRPRSLHPRRVARWHAGLRAR